MQAGKAKSQIKAKQPDETLQSELQDALTSKDVMSRVLERECRSNCCLSRKLELAEGLLSAEQTRQYNRLFKADMAANYKLYCPGA